MESYQLGNPIWVYYIDIDTNENLQVPQLIRGLNGEEFHIKKKDFPNYKFVRSEGQLDGTFDTTPRRIHFYYRNANWAEVQENIDMYLHLDMPTPMYDVPDGMQVGAALPKDIVVKAFARVATKTGEFWYELGSDQWVRYDHMEVVDDPFKKEKAPKGLPLDEKKSQLHHVEAIVDFVPGRAIDVYDEPFGRVIGSVQNGDKLTLVSKQDDSTGVTWYEAKDLGFINSLYVKRLDDQQTDQTPKED